MCNSISALCVIWGAYAGGLLSFHEFLICAHKISPVVLWRRRADRRNFLLCCHLSYHVVKTSKVRITGTLFLLSCYGDELEYQAYAVPYAEINPYLFKVGLLN
ncbi:hypothetical protein V1520DRAFT_341531 [Lipomyces starkeyi]